MAFFEGIKMTGGYGSGPDIISSCSVNVNKGEIDYINFDILNDNHELFVPLFCLAICFLESCKDNLNEIEPNIYKKIFDYTTNMYTTKSQIYLENI